VRVSRFERACTTAEETACTTAERKKPRISVQNVSQNMPNANEGASSQALTISLTPYAK
jgi:hypothetical protein